MHSFALLKVYMKQLKKSVDDFKREHNVVEPKYMEDPELKNLMDDVSSEIKEYWFDFKDTTGRKQGT